MNLKKLITTCALALFLGSTAAVSALPAPYPEPNDERSEREADLYEEATDAIDEEQWEEAIRRFARVAEMKGSRADGAIFWSAYALNKLGRRAEALKTVEALKKAYPQSRWLDDAQALALETRQAGGERVAPEAAGNDELKMIAINSLMHTDPEKAFPLLEKIVRGGSASKKVRERALFILSQSPSPRAQALLGDIARGNANPEMQKDAVRYLGISGSKANMQLLSDMYASTTSRDVKKEILKSFLISGNRTHVVTLARSEKDPALRREAIRTLGIMGGKAELAALYTSESSRDAREHIIEALFLSGDADKLGELARGEKDQELRIEAIEKLGLIGGRSGPTLVTLYNSDNSKAVKRAVIKALFLQSNSRALIDLAKKESDPELKRAAMKQLSLMHDDEALAYMLQILNE